MLVYAKEPMGYLTIGPYRIYGKYFAYGRFGSTDIPRSVFKQHKSVLEEVEYTSEWFKNKFDTAFPDFSFKISEMWKLDFDVLIEVAKIIGIKYIKPKHPSDIEKRALRKSVRNIISN